MDEMLVLLGLALLAIPVAVVYLLIAQSGLRRRIAALETDIARLMADQGALARSDVAMTPEAASDPDPATRTPSAADIPAARVIAARETARPVAKVPQGPSRIAPLLTWVAANWFYVVSALSLALAGLFLVQYGV